MQSSKSLNVRPKFIRRVLLGACLLTVLFYGVWMLRYQRAAMLFADSGTQAGALFEAGDCTMALDLNDVSYGHQPGRYRSLLLQRAREWIRAGKVKKAKIDIAGAHARSPLSTLEVIDLAESYADSFLYAREAELLYSEAESRFPEDMLLRVKYVRLLRVSALNGTVDNAKKAVEVMERALQTAASLSGKKPNVSLWELQLELAKSQEAAKMKADALLSAKLASSIADLLPENTKEERNEKRYAARTISFYIDELGDEE